MRTTKKFWSYVEKTSTRWVWTGSINSDGYGNLRWINSNCKAHRVSYEICIGKIPEGFTIDHLCRIRNCVNPEHLEPVPHKVNVLRGFGVAGNYARRGTCSYGHELTPENTRISRGARVCVICKRLRANESSARNREKIRARSRKYYAAKKVPKK